MEQGYISFEAVRDATGKVMGFRVVRPDGKIIWLKELGEIVNDATGKPVIMAGVATDITEQKQRETE